MTRQRIEMRRSTADVSMPSHDGLRPLGPDDADAVGTLLYEAFHGGVDDEGESIDDAIALGRDLLVGEQSTSIVWAAACGVECEGRLVCAVVPTSRGPGDGFFSFTVTTPEHQRKGHARAAMRASMASLASVGYGSVSLWVTLGNRAAIATWEHLGFEPTGRRGELP